MEALSTYNEVSPKEILDGVSTCVNEFLLRTQELVRLSWPPPSPVAGYPYVEGEYLEIRFFGGTAPLRDIIVGNICSLCAMITDSISGTRKEHRQILAIQILSMVFYGAGSIILKGYSSAVQNIVGILRNLAAIKNIKSRLIEWTLIALGVVLGIAFNNRGLLGWLPVVANLEYSISVFRYKENARGLKIAFLINMLMYAVFSALIMNFVGAASCTVIAVTTAISLIKGRKEDSSQDSVGQ